MSKDAALSFLRMAMENQDLQKKILSLAKEEGYEFTVDELSEEDLDQAAGGVLLHKIDTTIAGKIESPTITKTTLEP